MDSDCGQRLCTKLTRQVEGISLSVQYKVKSAKLTTLGKAAATHRGKQKRRTAYELTKAFRHKQQITSMQIDRNRFGTTVSVGSE